MPEMASVNGKITPLEEATVSALDRGFIFGDGVYEVIRVYKGRPYLLDQHLGRLARSAQGIRLDAPPSETIGRQCLELVEKSGLAEAMIYIQVTRGVARRRSAFPDGVTPTVFIMVEHPVIVDGQKRESGVRIISVVDTRWRHNDIKSINLLPKVLMAQQAKGAGAHEAVYIGRDGEVYECTGSNLFYVKGGALVTPALGNALLPGITRADLLEIADSLHIPTQEKRFFLSDLKAADEVFLSGTLTEVLGVTMIDESTVGSGKVGPVTRRLHDAYCEKAKA